MSARTIAIGDIHGCSTALDVLLNRLEPTTNDTIIVLGDVVDRGPGTKQVIERLLELRKTCNLVCLMGNHEEMLLNAFDGGEMQAGWLSYGGREALDSYGGNFTDVPEIHIEFLKSFQGYHETESEIFIHANLEPGIPLEQQSNEWLRWVRLTGLESAHPSGKRVICGHTTQRSGVPVLFDGWVCIDTCVYGGKCLTSLDVTNDTVVQVRETGEFRAAVPLEELAIDLR